MLKRFLHQTPCVFRRLLYGLFLQFFAFTFSFASVQETKSVRDYPLNIEFNKNTLVETFQIIESATDYHFAYDRGKLDPNIKFSGKYKIPRTVGDVLLDIAKETGLSFKQINKNITVINANKGKDSSPSLEVIIEDVIITGKVTSEEGEALPGVNIIVKGTNIGTVTDIDGNYSLKSPEGSTTLIFSFIGYASQEVPVNGRSVINIMLTSDIAQLSEIVVVGYGEMERKDVTGSISSVGSDEIKDLGATRVDQALLGKAAGVQVMPVSGEPGAPPQIRIRGVGSISAAGDPLYVVDGFPMQSIQTINPNDIESIDVLKDASATAIYGSRGSNGVIIINTKRGKEGKPTFKYDAYFGFQKIAKMPEFQSAKEEAQHYFDGIRNRNIDEGNDVSGPVETWKIAVPVTVVEVLEGRTPTQPGVTLDFKDPFDEILVTAPQQQHQLSSNGGSENVKYAISGEYLSQDGIILNSNFKRYSLRSNIDSKLTDKLSIKTSINPSYVDKTNVGGTSFDGVNSNTDILYNSLVIPQYYSLYNPDGSYFPFGGGLDAVVTTQNPVALANEVINRQKGIGLLGNINVEYAILDELKVNVAAGTNLQAIKGMSFKPQLPAFFNNPAVGSDYSALRLNWLTETTLNYNKSFGDHNFSGLAGFTTQKETVESNSLTSNRYPNNLVPTLSAVSGIITGGTSNYYEWSLVSYLGRVNYNYLGKYYFTASLRTDGSSRFGSENKFGVFPSLALAWRISDESFMQSMPALSEMKLRTSYGSTGNNNIGNYEHYATINYDKYTLGGGAVGGYAPGRLANPSLTWETQKQINVGVDLSFVDNRLGFNIDYFNSRNYDLLLNVNVPDVTGFSTALKNIGEVKNSGWEFVASTVNTTGDFKWTTNFNISTYKNEVVKLGPEGDPIISGGNITMIGQPIGMFYGWLSDGVFKNQAELDAGPIFNPGARDASRVGDVRFVDVSGPEGVPDGVINSLDKTIMGSPYPDFYYGMTNNLSYKNISLTIGIQGSKGNEILAISRNQLANNRSRFRQLSIMNDYWKSESEPGDGSPRPNDTPTGNFRGQFSQLWLDTGTYLRINNITLGYLLPEAFVERLNLSSLRVYINTINPFLFTKHIGFNPDVSRSGSALNPGNEQYDYPVAKSIKLGLNVGF
ncbi:MAG: SusC/RagA family TonB-linked outer membrane protein [Imperialibacter sp.]|uniref:SusC/RagA family TonB-linked outer membrane protein n=1 Tax=Imperialibacter sp. TaxID=2038411 RepID=UPI003A867966